MFEDYFNYDFNQQINTCYEYCNYGIDCVWNIDWFTIIVYLGSFIALYFAYILEYKDLYCPYDNQKCKVGNGAAYEKGKVNKNDNYETILQKIRISSRYDEASVYWRRCIIFTVLLLYPLLVLVLRRLPNGYEVLVSFTIIYLFTYLFLVYYQESVSKPATKQVTEATKKIWR